MRTHALAALLVLASAGCASAQPEPSSAGGGLLIVTNKQEASATIIDVGSGRTVATLPTGTGPHEAAVSHDSRWAVVTDYGDQRPGGTLTIIDLNALSVARKIDLAPHQRPHGVAFLPGDSVIAVTSETSRAVLLVNFASGAVTPVMTDQAGSHMLAVSSDGGTIYTANVGGGSVTAIDVRTRRARSVPVAPRTEGIGFAAGHVWVGSNEQNTVTVLDGRTLAPVDTLPAPGFPYRANTGGRYVLVSNPMSSQVRLFDAATRAEVAVITIPLDPARAVPGADGSAGPVGAVLTRDGRTAYVALQGMNSVAEIDTETRQIRRYFATGAGPDGIAFAPR